MRIVIAAVALMFVSGCTTHRTLRPGQPESYERVNRRSEESSATLRLENGDTLLVRSLRLAPASVTWLDSRNKTLVRAQASQVREVRTVSHGRGALQGLGMGALVGGAIGVLFGLGGVVSDGFYSPTESAVLLGGTFAAAGGIIGTPIGAIVGARDVYSVEGSAAVGRGPMDMCPALKVRCYFGIRIMTGR